MQTLAQGSFEMRVCLKCNAEFKSAGSGNRICGKCALLNMKAHSPPKGTKRESMGSGFRRGVNVSKGL